MSAVHNVWVIVNKKTDSVCYDQNNGQLCVYKTQQDAVIAMSNFIKTSPIEFVLYKTQINLPWHRV